MQKQQGGSMERIIWAAMVGSVVMLGGVILVMHQLGMTGQEEVIAPLTVILALGFLAVIPFPIVRMLLTRKRPTPLPSSSPEDPQLAQQRQLRNLVLLGGIAEVPVTMGLVYAALGGTLQWALILWGISLLCILSLLPEEEDVGEKQE